MSFSVNIQRKAGSTSQKVLVFLEDSSSAGNGKTALTNASAGMSAYYKRNTASAAVAISVVNITTLGTFVSGGLKKVDDTNMPGTYEFHIPDAVFASGADQAKIEITATGIFPCIINVDITATDTLDGVRGGMTALPSTACAAPTGSLPTTLTPGGTGQSITQADIDQIINSVAATV